MLTDRKLVVRNGWSAAGPLVLVAATLACYWIPLTSDQTSILWDAADYHQVVQNYLSEELRAGRLPFWTPYPWSGYPFLADPQVGAWYPPNWLFFVFGVPPRALVLEHCVHALFACLGTYMLVFRLVRDRMAATFAGLCFGLSGFFAGHSSHTGILQTASWLPWLLLLFDRANAAATPSRVALAGLAAGVMILAGHFQTSLYAFLALALFATARAVENPSLAVRTYAIAAAIPVIGTSLSAIATVPGLELVLLSVRTQVDAVAHREGMIPLRALATLVQPNYYSLFSGGYRGPSDITQFYFYAGILLLPMAAAGLTNRVVRRAAVLLIVPTVWYAMGQSAGLYSLVARLPGFSSIRAPVNIWFVPAMGLALLAGAGVTAMRRRSSWRWLPAAVVFVAAADLFYWNSYKNPLAYARVSYTDLYWAKEDVFRFEVAATLPPLTRFDAPEFVAAFGPLSHFFDVRTETTYGYGPMPLRRYKEYIAASAANGRLRDALNVRRFLETTGFVRDNPNALPRAYFPARIVTTRSRADGLHRLATLDPAQEGLVDADVHLATQDPAAAARVQAFSPGHYGIHYRAASPSLLVLSSAWYPGWTATMQDRQLDVVPVNHALTGIVVPAGEGEISVDYHSRWFPAGAAVTLVTMVSSVWCIGRRRRTNRSRNSAAGSGAGT
jgi:hypothetical protein